MVGRVIKTISSSLYSFYRRGPEAVNEAYVGSACGSMSNLSINYRCLSVLH